MHNLIAAIAATPQQDAAPKTGVTASDAGSFRDVLCAKVVGQSQARATASGAKQQVAGSPMQSNLKSGRLDDGNANTVKVQDSKTREPRDQDKGDSPYTTSMSAAAARQSLIAPVAAEGSAGLIGGSIREQVGTTFSDTVGVVTANPSGGVPISAAAQLTTAAPAENPDIVMNSPAPSIAAMSPSQAANRFQYQYEAAAEADIPLPAGERVVPPSSTPDSDPPPLPAAFHGGTVRASGPSLLDALAHPASPQQKTDGSERSPLVASTHKVTPERRDVPLQNQPASSDNAGSEDTAVSVTAAPAASASQAETAANVLPNSNIPAGAAASQSLNSIRKANSGEPGWAGRKEDRNPARLSQPEIDAQPESQVAPSKAGELNMRTDEISAAAAVMGHNPNPGKTDQSTAPGGPGPGGPQSLRASPDNQRMGDGKGQRASPTPASSTADTPSADPPMLQSARVLERMGQSEIRVGLNTANFGNLELHTSVNQDRVAATLATSHSELRAALAAEMPSLEHAMAQQHLTLDSFHLDTRSGAQDGNHGAAGDQQNRSQTWTGTAAELGAASDCSLVPETVAPQGWIRPYSSGLNVHA